MSSDDELAFIREIALRPDDALPRLIYADWLEEQGDAKADFIRLHCELPNVTDPALRTLMQQRANELLREHYTPWCEQLGAGVQWHRFRLGLIDDVVVQAARLIETNGQVLREAPLTGIGVCLKAEQVRPFSHLPNLAQLRRLRLGGSELRDHGLGLLLESPQFPKLHELWLSDCGLTDASVNRLIDHPSTRNLKRLVVEGNTISDSLLRRLPTLFHQ